MLSKSTSYFLEGHSTYSVNLSDENASSFLLQNNSNVTLDLQLSSKKNDIYFNLGQNSNLTLRIIVKHPIESVNLHANVSRETKFNIFIADFFKNSISFKSIVDLDEENASSSFHLGVLSKNNENKNYDISFNHKVGKTYSELDAYGVSKDSSMIKINGTSHILKDSVKANANQKAKVIVFDETAKAIANPILKIDCNDVVAKHACAIGSLKDEHVYYLLSRGISLKEARNLITLGYLLPISKHFSKEDEEMIIELIEGEF